MKIEEKINMIGKILADIQLEIKMINKTQNELYNLLTNSDKLDFERYWKKTFVSDSKNDRKY